MTQGEMLQNLFQCKQKKKLRNNYLRSIFVTVTYIMDTFKNYTLKSLYFLKRLRLLTYLIPSYKTTRDTKKHVLCLSKMTKCM